MPSGFPAFPSAPSNPLGKKAETKKTSPPPPKYQDSPRSSMSKEPLVGYKDKRDEGEKKGDGK